MKPFIDRINSSSSSGPLIADGGLGSMLVNVGLDISGCPEEYNLTKPDILTDIAQQYLDAGADIIHTNTFGGSPAKLAQHNLQDKTEELCTAAVQIIKGVVQDKAYVSGSVGPSGKMLTPYGETEPEELHKSFLRQISAMIDAGIDALCIETMIDLRESEIAIKAARQLSQTIPIVATMTFNKTPRGFFTIIGNDIPTAINGMLEAGADIVGSNCGNGIEIMVEVAREFRKETNSPLIIQANAGLPTLVQGEVTYQESPSLFAEKATELLDLKVNIIGGCCGTTPEHIAAIKKVSTSTQ